MSDEAPEQLAVAVQTAGDEVILVVSGELDAYSAPTLDAAVDRALQGGAHSLVLDLAGVTFIDSSGLRSMIRARKQAGDGAGALRLRDPQAATVRLLEITGLTEHFTIDAASA